jgi:hypothetical protein
MHGLLSSVLHSMFHIVNTDLIGAASVFTRRHRLLILRLQKLCDIYRPLNIVRVVKYLKLRYILVVWLGMEKYEMLTGFQWGSSER